MDLTERIARLIDPRPWNLETAWWIFATHQQTHEELVAEAQEQTLIAARRVIDGLGLHAEPVYAFNGDRITHIFGQIPKEDTPAAPHEWADITTYADSPNRVHIDTATGEARTEEPE